MKANQRIMAGGEGGEKDEDRDGDQQFVNDTGLVATEKSSYAKVVQYNQWDGVIPEEEDHVSILGESLEARQDLEPDIQITRNDNGVANFKLSNAFKQKAWRQWRQTLIVKLLGKKMSYDFMKRRLERMWAKEGRILVTDVPNNFFLVRFERKEDMARARNGGPWIILDHYLSVQDWVPNFQPAKASVDRVVAWIRFQNFPQNMSKRNWLSR